MALGLSHLRKLLIYCIRGFFSMANCLYTLTSQSKAIITQDFGLKKCFVINKGGKRSNNFIKEVWTCWQQFQIQLSGCCLSPSLSHDDQIWAMLQGVKWAPIVEGLICIVCWGYPPGAWPLTGLKGTQIPEIQQLLWTGIY